MDKVLIHDPNEHVGEAFAAAVPALAALRDEGIMVAVGAGVRVAG